MGRPSRYSPEVRERAVRKVLENQREYASQWAAMASIASKIKLYSRDIAEVGSLGRARGGTTRRTDDR